MSYHSEKIVRTIVLAANKRGILQLVGVTSQQIEDGALTSATNWERKHYFTYAMVIMSWMVTILGIPSGLLILAYMSILGNNLGLVLCMPFWIPYFITNSLERKVKQCDRAKKPLVFSSKDLRICLLKAGMLGFAIMGTIVWIISGQAT